MQHLPDAVPDRMRIRRWQLKLIIAVIQALLVIQLEGRTVLSNMAGQKQLEKDNTIDALVASLAHHVTNSLAQSLVKVGDAKSSADTNSTDEESGVQWDFDSEDNAEELSTILGIRGPTTEVQAANGLVVYVPDDKTTSPSPYSSTFQVKNFINNGQGELVNSATLGRDVYSVMQKLVLKFELANFASVTCQDSIRVQE